MGAPLIESIPRFNRSRGQEAIEVARSVGLHLDSWQQNVLLGGLGVRGRARKWAAFEVGLLVPRQNGKTAVLEARALAGLFAFGEELIIHSAHLADTSKEAFNRICDLLESTEDLSRHVKHVWRTNGHESIELDTGQRLRFRTRTKGGGRGFSADCVIFDEAMILGEASLAAILPVVSARKNPQVWYAGSAVDRLIHEHGVVWARLRERGRKGDDPSLTFFEWAAETQDDVLDLVIRDPGLLDDQRLWAQANPALNVRIQPELVENELRSMDPRTFCVERLGIGDWPATDGSGASVIDLAAWDGLADVHSVIRNPVAFAFDVTPDRAATSICAAGARSDGLLHLELIDRHTGTGWVVDRLVALNRLHGPSAVVCDAVGPAASLTHDLLEKGVSVETVGVQEHAQACGQLYDSVGQQTVRHLGQPELRAAIKGAARRPLGDAWAWSRKTSAIDISPLVGCTLAYWGWQTGQNARPFTLAW